MTSCWACEAQLDPAWKFCIRCGMAVSSAPATPALALAPVSREPVSAYGLFGWILAAIGALLLIAGVIVFFVYG